VLSPLRRATGAAVAKCFERRFLQEVGHVNKVISDNGKQFQSQYWKAMLERNNITPIYTSVYHPASNPAERIMRELGTLFRIHCDGKHDRWDEFLPAFQDAINSLPNLSTGFPPLQVLFNRRPDNKIAECIRFPRARTQRYHIVLRKAVTNIKKSARARLRAARNQSVSHVEYQPGDKVLVKTHPLSDKKRKVFAKFRKRYFGPLEVVRLLHPNVYLLKSCKTGKDRGYRHVSHLRPFVG
jgi:Integrase core domain.